MGTHNRWEEASKDREREKIKLACWERQEMTAPAVVAVIILTAAAFFLLGALMASERIVKKGGVTAAGGQRYILLRELPQEKE